MTDTKTAVATFDGFKTEFSRALPQIAKLLPKHVSPEKFEAAVVTAVTINPDLLSCDRRSLFNACRTAAELGLSLNPALGEADILKQYDKRAGGYVARFSPRFGGLMKLGRQSGQLKTIYAHTVRANDEFDRELGMNKTLRHKPAAKDRGELVGVYCVWVLADDTKDYEYMDREQVMAIKARSSAKTKEGQIVGPWVTDEEEMWRKTVVRRASKYWPRSSEVNAMLRATAVEDEAALSDDAAAMESDAAWASMDVTGDGGAFIDGDATDAKDANKPNDAGRAAVAGLEGALGVAQTNTAKNAQSGAQQKRVRMLEVPQKNDGPDWDAYATALQTALSDAADVQKCLATNGIALNNMKAKRPDLHEAVMGFVRSLSDE